MTVARFEDIVDELRGDLRRLSMRSPEDRVLRLVENLLIAIYHLGTALEQDPALRGRPELAAIIEELQPVVRRNCVFLDSYPSDLVLDLTCVWDGGELERASRMRSAVQFFIELIRGTPAADDLTGLPESLDELDEHLRRWDDREGGAPPAEPGIPRSHWWWSFPAPTAARPAR